MWSGISRRKFPRAEYPCKITVRRKDHPDSVTSHTENIGVGGICVILPKDLGIFAPVEIELDLLDGQPVIKSDGTIVWIVGKKETQGTYYDTGVEFTTLRKEDTERIKELVEKLIGKAENDNDRR